MRVVITGSRGFIGGDIKKIPNVNWGSGVTVLHKSIEDYYKATPAGYAEGAKKNTADMILITKGTVDSLLKALGSICF